MSVDYSKLVPGQKISGRSYVLDVETVSRYIDAVDDRSRLYSEDNKRGLVPPMAVSALSLRGVINALEIPGGTLHVGQEFEFGRSVEVGESLECTATLTQNSVRGEWRFMVVEVEVDDSEGRRVMDGKSTIMVPA